MNRSGRRHFGYVLVYIVYISLGIPDSILGVAWPSIQTEFAVPIFYGSVVVAIVTILAACASLSYGLIEKHLETGYIVFMCSLLTTVGLLGVGLSNSFVLLCISAIPMGLGAGAVDATVNNYVSQNLSAKHMIWLHGFWGIGAIIGPLAYGVLQAGKFGWHSSALITALLQGLISVFLLFNVRNWNTGNTIRTTIIRSVPRSYFSKSQKVSALLRVIFTMFFSGLDITIGLWLSTYLIYTGRALTENVGFYMSAYYASVTFGRFIIGFISQKIKLNYIVLFGIFASGIGLCVSLLSNSSFLLVGVIILGIGLSPIHPFTLYETHQAFETEMAAKVTSIQISASLIGGLALPAIVGYLITSVGMMMMPIVEFIMYGIVLLLRIVLIKMKKVDCV